MTPIHDSRDGTHLFDLAIVVSIIVVATALSLAPIAVPTPVRVVFGLIGLLLAPGYVTLVAVIQLRLVIQNNFLPDLSSTFPNSDSNPLSRPDLLTLEWVVLTFVMSVSVITLLGLLLAQFSVGITPMNVILSVTGYTLLVGFLAAAGRYRTETGYQIPRKVNQQSLVRLARPPTTVDAVLNISLVLLLVVSMIVVAVPLPSQESPQFTEFALLAEDESGEAVTRDYLATAGAGDTRRIHSLITNHERQTIEYTLFVQVQRTVITNQSVDVTNHREINRTTIQLDPNGTARIIYEFQTRTANSGCRVAFLLYAGDVPESPNMDNAYREVHLWHTDDPPPGQDSCRDLNDITVQRTSSENVSGDR